MTAQQIARQALMSVHEESVQTDTMVIVVVVQATNRTVATETVSNVANRDAITAALTYALEDALNVSEVASQVEILKVGNA
jgi:hypothetical protein